MVAFLHVNVIVKLHAVKIHYSYFLYISVQFLYTTGSRSDHPLHPLTSLTLYNLPHHPYHNPSCSSLHLSHCHTNVSPPHLFVGAIPSSDESLRELSLPFSTYKPHHCVPSSSPTAVLLDPTPPHTVPPQSFEFITGLPSIAVHRPPLSRSLGGTTASSHRCRHPRQSVIAPSFLYSPAPMNPNSNQVNPSPKPVVAARDEEEEEEASKQVEHESSSVLLKSTKN